LPAENFNLAPPVKYLLGKGHLRHLPGDIDPVRLRLLLGESAATERHLHFTAYSLNCQADEKIYSGNIYRQFIYLK
jgi:hypothetical protein